jgi:hypothetical protein
MYEIPLKYTEQEGKPCSSSGLPVTSKIFRGTQAAERMQLYTYSLLICHHSMRQQVDELSWGPNCGIGLNG